MTIGIAQVQICSAKKSAFTLDLFTCIKYILVLLADICIGVLYLYICVCSMPLLISQLVHMS